MCTPYMCTDAAKCMRLMRKHVIPRISAEWETVSAFLEYSVHTTKDIRKHYRFVIYSAATQLTESLSVNSSVSPFLCQSIPLSVHSSVLTDR